MAKYSWEDEQYQKSKKKKKKRQSLFEMTSNSEHTSWVVWKCLVPWCNQVYRTLKDTPQWLLVDFPWVRHYVPSENHQKFLVFVYAMNNGTVFFFFSNQNITSSSALCRPQPSSGSSSSTFISKLLSIFAPKRFRFCFIHRNPLIFL